MIELYEGKPGAAMSHFHGILARTPAARYVRLCPGVTEADFVCLVGATLAAPLRYTPPPDPFCSICHGSGFFVSGNSGTPEDGYAPEYLDCECFFEPATTEVQL